MIPKTIIHLLSGGMDSVVMLYDLQAQGHNIHCLLVDYGQRHVKELECAKWHCDRLDLLFTVLNLPKLRGSELTGDKGGIVVPNRNAILLSLAVNLAVAAGADTVTYGCNADDQETFPDCRREFIDALNKAVREAGCEVEVCAPYLDRRKWWIGGVARDLGVPLAETWSCYLGGKTPCGKCPACLKREAALK